MTVMRTDHNQVFGPDGSLISEEFVEVDVTDEANTDQLVQESSQAVDELLLVVESLNTLRAMTREDVEADSYAVLMQVVTTLDTIARQVVREARLTSGRTESTSTGTEVP